MKKEKWEKLTEYKKIILSIVLKWLYLGAKQNEEMEFEWGRKRFVIKRVN